MDWAKTIARRDEKRVLGLGVPYIRELTVTTSRVHNLWDVMPECHVYV